MLRYHQGDIQTVICPTGWGPQDSVHLVYKWLNSMVYGRYNELVNGDYFMVYKPTYNLGAPSCGDLTLNNADFTDEKTVI